MDSDAASREGYQWATVCGITGRMGSSWDCADDPGHQWLAAIEDFDMNPIRHYAERCKRLLHVRHETGRPTEVDVRVGRDADVVQCRLRKSAWSIEIFAEPVARSRFAVADKAAAPGKAMHEAADFAGKWMMPPVARGMQPKYLPGGVGRCKRV